MALKIYMRRRRSPSCGSSFSICAVMRSMPVPSVDVAFWFRFFSSFKVNALRCSVGCMCVARSRSTSWSRSLLCGVNTSDRCSAKISAFSFSLLAHGPGGIEYLWIGGNEVWGFFFFYWFPNRIIVSFKVRNVVGEGCVPHFVECSFKFIASLVK